ncbi:MAG: heme o synthase [Phycisphaerales bacterium]
MTTTPANPSLDTAVRQPESRRPAPTATGVRALIETTKPGITRLVTMTSAVGFAMVVLSNAAVAEGTFAARLGGWATLWNALACLAGTALSAAGANTINQWMESERDAAMPRTQGRPLPSGRATHLNVLAFGIAASLAGLGLLWWVCGLVPMLISLACLVSYVVMYTPLKPVSPLATFIGAIPGALPPMIGSSAASHIDGWNALREPAGLALFALMFIWQIPHFLALAWLYRDDYAKGGFAVLPAVDTKGSMTVWTVALWALAFIPAAVLPAVLMPSVLGMPYAMIAAVSCVAFLVMAGRLVLERTRERARGVFLASVMHLPLLLIAMVVEGTLRVIW